MPHLVSLILGYRLHVHFSQCRQNRQTTKFPMFYLDSVSFTWTWVSLQVWLCLLCTFKQSWRSVKMVFWNIPFRVKMHVDLFSLASSSLLSHVFRFISHLHVGAQHEHVTLHNCQSTCIDQSTVYLRVTWRQTTICTHTLPRPTDSEDLPVSQMRMRLDYMMNLERTLLDTDTLCKLHTQRLCVDEKFH